MHNILFILGNVAFFGAYESLQQVRHWKGSKSKLGECLQPTFLVVKKVPSNAKNGAATNTLFIKVDVHCQEHPRYAM